MVSQGGHEAHETASLALWVRSAESEKVCSVCHVAVVVERFEIIGLTVVVLLEKAGEVDACGDCVVGTVLVLVGGCGRKGASLPALCDLIRMRYRVPERQ